jgi:hypothetical protein
MILKGKFKDGHRVWWHVQAIKTQVITSENLLFVYSDSGYYETEWQVSIKSEDANCVFSDLLTTQYDEIIQIEQIVLAWIGRVNEVAIGMGKYCNLAPIELDDEI